MIHTKIQYPAVGWTDLETAFHMNAGELKTDVY